MKIKLLKPVHYYPIGCPDAIEIKEGTIIEDAIEKDSLVWIKGTTHDFFLFDHEFEIVEN